MFSKVAIFGAIATLFISGASAQYQSQPSPASPANWQYPGPPYNCKTDQYCNQQACHSNGCDQCLNGYFKKDYSHPCESCSQFSHCKVCQDFAGCGTCEEGYYNEYPLDHFKGGCKPCDEYGVKIGACPNKGKPYSPTYPSPTPSPYTPSPSPYVPSPSYPTPSPSPYYPTPSPSPSPSPYYPSPSYPTYPSPSPSPYVPPQSPYYPTPSPNTPYNCKTDQNCIPTTCHSNGCDQCKPGYFKRDYTYPCESCSMFPNCASCQDFAGCGTCNQGYYNENPKGPFKGGCKPCDKAGVEMGVCPNTGKYSKMRM